MTFPKSVMFPGSADEVELKITFKEDVLAEEDPDSTYLIRVAVLCTNPEFASLEESVFAAKLPDSEENKPKLQLRIKREDEASIKIRISVPRATSQTILSGTLSVQLESTHPLVIPITATADLPQISTHKELFSVRDNMNVINLPARKNGRIPPLLFRNHSHFSFSLEVEACSNEDFSERAYDIVSQNTVSCLANSQFTVNLQLRLNSNYEGPIPDTDTIRKILVMKVKNSSVYFHYPLEAFVF